MRRRATKSGALGLHPHLLVGRDDERGAPLLGHVIVQREYLPQENPSDALDWGVNGMRDGGLGVRLAAGVVIGVGG